MKLAACALLGSSFALACAANPPEAPIAPAPAPDAAPPTTASASASAPTATPTWRPPNADGAVPSPESVSEQCAAIEDRLEAVVVRNAKEIAKALDDIEHSPPPLPAEQVAWCLAQLRRIILYERPNAERMAREAEAPNNLAQIAKNMQAAYERGAMGAPKPKKLCPSAKPIPAKIELVDDMKYQSAPSEWRSDPGWSCLKFSIEEPQYHQYEVKVDAKGFVATARRKDGDTIHELSLAGTITRGAVIIAPRITERR